MVLVLLELLAALLALEGVVAGVDIAEAELGLEVPMLGERPGVTVSDARAGHPAFVARVLELLVVCAEETEREADTSNIVLASNEMGSYEAAHQCVAEPVAVLRLYHPILPLHIVGEGEEVKVAVEFNALV